MGQHHGRDCPVPASNTWPFSLDFIKDSTKPEPCQARDAMESCIPPGFRFHPTDEELVGYYLKKKVASQKIDLDVIRDIDLYRIEPWDLQEQCRIGYEEQSEWYFFSHKDKKYPTGTRTNRATMAGFWKATGRDKAVHDKSKVIGMRKTLVFYKGRAPNGQKTDWIMHEYRLESEENGPPQEEGWVVCRAFKKRATTYPTRSNVANIWNSNYCYDDIGWMNPMFNHHPNLFTPMHKQPPPMTPPQCKQEESELLDDLHLLHSSDFVQLPQLESPPLPHPSSKLQSKDNTREDQLAKKVTDWRALDKFVASQLSHEDNNNNTNNRFDDIVIEEHDVMGDFNLGSNSEMALLLLHNEKEVVDQFLINSSSEKGEICIFEQ